MTAARAADAAAQRASAAIRDTGARRRVGVLALQGGFAPHQAAIEQVGARAVLVRGADELRGVDALVLPGGESTTMLRLIDTAGIGDALSEFAASGRPILATCAGLILAAARVTHPEQESFGWIDATVARNAWGRQVASFAATSDDGAHPLVFIRAPRITAVGPGVEVLATYRGEPVLVRNGAVTGATFHPELTPDRSVHLAALGIEGDGPHRLAGPPPALTPRSTSTGV